MSTASIEEPRQRVTGAVFLAGAVLFVGGLLYGYNNTVVAGTILFVEKQFALSPDMQELVVSASVIGCLFGAAVAGPCADRYGRRSVLFAIAVVFFLGGFAMEFASSVMAIAGGRVVSGVGIGAISVVGVLYLAEIAPDHARGRLIALFIGATIVGMVFAYLTELDFAKTDGWRWMLGMPAFIAVPYVVGVLLLPESPRWYFGRGLTDRARASLERVAGKGTVDAEYKKLEALSEAKQGRWLDLLAADVRPAVLIGIGLGVFQRITGINIIFFYAPTVFELAGMKSLSMDILSGLWVGVAMLAAQIFSVFVIDHLGRRPLLIAGYVGMLCGVLPLAAAFAWGSDSVLAQYAAVGGLMVLAAAWMIGPAGVSFLLISEIYPQRLRGPAMSVATVAIWVSFLIVSLTFLTSIDLIGRTATFAVYGLLCLLAAIFAYFLVPETKGKSLEEISASWKRG